MGTWHHSGLEGLCAALSGEHDTALKASLARELFNDAERFDKDYSVTRTWTLSRPGRVRKFEGAWLSEELPSKKRSGLSARKALSTCVDTLLDAEADAALPATLECAPTPQRARERLHDEVLGAMADGFATERYPSSAVTAFRGDMDALAARWDGRPGPLLRDILYRLVAAAIYGPDHPEALSPETSKTFDEAGGPADGDPAELCTQTVVVTHLYDGIAARIGDSVHYTPASLVLVGRSSHEERYRARLAELGLSGLAEGRRAEILRLPELHGRVSACHGALACEQGTWYYYDLDSTNGTLVSGETGTFPVEHLCTVQPGDVLYLGTRNGHAGDGTLFMSGAALLVSMRVDPGALSKTVAAGGGGA